MSVDTEYYDVRGYNIRQLRNYIKNVAREYTKSFTWGETSYDLSWRYINQDNVRGCFVGQVFVEMKVIQILPRLHAEVSLGVEDYKVWSSFYKAMEYFQDKHQNLIFRYAKTLANRVKGVGFSSTCSSLEELVNKEAMDVLNELKTERTKLNIDTDYGAKFGATIVLSDDFD
jgi:predicted secreted Zn-dependent protease